MYSPYFNVFTVKYVNYKDTELDSKFEMPWSVFDIGILMCKSVCKTIWYSLVVTV